MNKVAVIPARGGSKRIPRKNIIRIGGIPLLGHTINRLTESLLFDEIFVSTEDQEIAEIARDYGAKVPFVRQPELADDYASTKEVIVDAIKRLNLDSFPNLAVCCVYPSSALLTNSLILNSYKRFLELDNGFLALVQEYGHPIQRAMQINDQGKLAPINPEKVTVRTQDLPKAFHDSGSAYWGSIRSWMSEGSILENAFGYEIARSESVDLDNIEDLKLLSALIKYQKNSVQEIQFEV